MRHSFTHLGSGPKPIIIKPSTLVICDKYQGEKIKNHTNTICTTSNNTAISMQASSIINMTSNDYGSFTTVLWQNTFCSLRKKMPQQTYVYVVHSACHFWNNVDTNITDMIDLFIFPNDMLKRRNINLNNRYVINDNDDNWYLQCMYLVNNISAKIYPNHTTFANFKNKRSIISIVVHCHNSVPQHLSQLVASLNNQTFKDWTLILVNDQSDREDTLQMLNDIQTTNDNIILISPNKDTDKGRGASRNTGWDIARSDYLFFVDDTDRLDVTILEKFFLVLKSEPELTFVTSFGTVDGDGTHDTNNCHCRGTGHGFVNLLENCLSTCFLIKNINLRYSTDSDLLRYDGEDWNFWNKLAFHNHIGHTIPEHLLHFKKCEHTIVDHKIVIDKMSKNYDTLYKDPLKYPYAFRNFYKLTKGFFDVGYGKFLKLCYSDTKYTGDTKSEKTYISDIFEKRIGLNDIPPYKYTLSKEMFDLDHYKKTVADGCTYELFINNGQHIPWHCVPYKQPQPLQIQPLQIQPLLIKGTIRTDLLLIVPWMNLGGADRFNLNLVNHLIKNNKTVTIIATDCDMIEKKINTWFHLFKEKTQDIHILYHYVSIHEYLNYIKYIIYNRDPKNIIISNSMYGINKTKEIREFVDINNTDEHRTTLSYYVHAESKSWNDGGYARFACDYVQYLDHIFVTTEYLKNWTMDRTDPIHHQKIVTWLIGTDIDDFTYVHHDIPDTINIASMFRFDDGKKHKQLMQIIKMCQTENLNVRFTVVGNGKYADEMQKFQKIHQLKNLDLIVTYTNKITQYLHAADLLIQTTEWEGMPSIFFEAIACGVPVLTVNVGGISTLIRNGVNGFMIEPDSNKTDNETAQYMKIIRDLAADSNTLNILKNNCIEYREKINCDQIFTEITNCHFIN